MAAADRIAAAGDSLPRPARDPVNLPMIRNWLEAVGGALPDQGCLDTAPPAMIQVWTMPGLHGTRADDDPLGAMTALLDEAGYPSVVATNCDQVYLRPVKLGRAAGRLRPAGGRRRPQAHRARRGLVRDHQEHVDLGGRAGGHHGLPRAQVRGRRRPDARRGARPLRLPWSCAPWSRRTPSSSGPGPRPGNCASSAATAAGRCAIRPARCARRAGPGRGPPRVRRRGRDRRGLQLRRAPSPARARQEAADRDRARPAA